MTNNNSTLSQMTLVEATEKLEEFKQQLVDENYQELVDDGETTRNIKFEILEALEIILYYLETLSTKDFKEDQF